MTPLLDCKAVSKSFGGLTAVDHVDIAIGQGEIVGLIGPNGSGKSTLVNLITGIAPVTGGTIRFAEHDITRLPSWRIARLGIARTFQLLRLFKSLSVLDNVTLPLNPRLASGQTGSFFGRRGAAAEERLAAEKGRALLALFDLDGFADRPATALSIGQQRMVELARGLIVEPKLFVLDEPAAGLSPPNVERLIGLIRRMRDEHGVTILLVEHVMKVVQELCDRVVVLDYGVKIADGDPHSVTRDPRVVDAYLGGGKGPANALG